MYLIAFTHSPGRIAVYFESFCVLLRIDKAGVDTNARVVRAFASYCVFFCELLRAGVKSGPESGQKKPGVNRVFPSFVYTTFSMLG